MWRGECECDGVRTQQLEVPGQQLHHRDLPSVVCGERLHHYDITTRGYIPCCLMRRGREEEREYSLSCRTETSSPPSVGREGRVLEAIGTDACRISYTV